MSTSVVGGFIFYITRNPKRWGKFLSPSAKFSLPMMAGLFVGTVVTEIIMFDIKQYPEDYGLQEEEQYEARKY